MARFFKKISFKQYEKDIKKNKKEYEEYSLPKRTTKHSAGYDFFALEDIILKPNEIKKIPTGIKAKFNSDEVLFLIERSSLGFKKNARMCNQVGVIDADYYNNKENEGHLWVSLQNEGTEDLKIKKGEGFVQGIFLKYYTIDNEEENFEERKGKY